MNIRKIIQLFLVIIVIAFFSNCIEKFDLTEIDEGSGNVNVGGDTVYIQVSPDWEGFNKPQDILIGREPFIYVADTDNDRIVMMNLDGQILGTRSVNRPVALAQDYKLNLIVCAKFDTLGQTFSAVYKYDLFSVNHEIENAPVKRLFPRLSDFAQPQREYTGATVFYDNKFYISRRGPNNSNLIDPDNSVLIFSSEDSLIGRVPLLSPTGTGVMSANQISSLTSYNSRTYDLVMTLIGENSFKVQSLQYISSPDFTGYLMAIQAQSADLMLPGFFLQPEGAAIDNADNIYVVDAAKDSIYKFNSFGDLLIGFGGEDKFSNPHSVAFFDKTLYVADTGNNRILRFILSTEL